MKRSSSAWRAWFTRESDDADGFTRGFAVALRLFPGSDSALDAIIREAWNSNYVCEDAIEGGAQRAEDPERKRLLESCALLVGFHTMQSMPRKSALNMLLRNIELVTKRVPDFGVTDLEQGQARIATVNELTTLTESEWADIRALFELLGEAS